MACHVSRVFFSVPCHAPVRPRGLSRFLSVKSWMMRPSSTAHRPRIRGTTCDNNDLLCATTGCLQDEKMHRRQSLSACSAIRRNWNKTLRAPLIHCLYKTCLWPEDVGEQWARFRRPLGPPPGSLPANWSTPPPVTTLRPNIMTIIQKVIERSLKSDQQQLPRTKPARAGGVVVPAADCFATDAIIAANERKSRHLSCVA